METDTTQIPLTKTICSIRLETLPSMPAVFCKLLALSFVRKPGLPLNVRVQKGQLLFLGFLPDPDRIRRYRQVCGFSRTQQDKTIPASYLQTLFISMLGKYVTSGFFPINPMGLIQTGQSFESKHPVMVDDILDLSCTLHDMTRTSKGIITRFLLEIHREKILVWQGISTYLTRDTSLKPFEKKPVQDQPLMPRMSIQVPKNTGRRYAQVSGDYNPHHLSDITARLIGFKQAIAHGMWSLARVLAGLEKAMTLSHPFAVDAAFKLPVFLPATLTLGYETIFDHTGQMNFDLRDAASGVPHLKGTLYFQNPEKSSI